jgi:hypothetical protein
VRRPAEFEAAERGRHASHGRYRLSPREAYVLRVAPIRGLSQAMSRRRRGEPDQGRILTIWLVHDENLSLVVEGLLARGFLALRGGAGPPYAELTAEGRTALEAGRLKPFR